LKISLAGASYTASSVVAAAQQTLNLIPEMVEVPNEPARIVLYGRPGLKHFVTLSPSQIRGMWAGGGRLFVIHHGNDSEVHEDGSVVTSPKTVAFRPLGLPDPAQIFSNGHQLLIIAAGRVYCDNGAGPEQCLWQLAGTGDTLPTGIGHTSANVLTRDSGNPFSAQMVGGPITINGRNYTVNQFSDPDHILILPFAPTETGVRYTYTGTDDATISASILSRHDGDVFTAAMVGKTITVNGRNYTVTTFQDADHIVINPAAPCEADVLWNIAGGDEVLANTGCFLDGYGIISGVPDPVSPDDPGRRFYISDLNDFTIWNPLQFGVKEGRSDYINSVQADHEELILLGTESTEVWQNIGSQVINGVATFPFQRVPGAFIQTGSAAMYGACSVGPSLCWIGGGANGEPVAYQMQGLQPVRISTHAVENAWRSAKMNVKDAVSYCDIENGHTFWVINFWQNIQTWVYDLNTQMWHERSGWDPSSEQYLRYKAWYHVFIPEWDAGNGMHIVGDPETGNLYEMSQDLFNDDGAKIIYLRAFPHLINENQYAYHHRLEILIQMGILPSGETPPDISFDWSDDHGQTFAHERTVPMAAADDFTKRAVIRRLGKSRDRVYRIGIEADNTTIALIDTFLEVTPGYA